MNKLKNFLKKLNILCFIGFHKIDTYEGIYSLGKCKKCNKIKLYF